MNQRFLLSTGQRERDTQAQKAIIEGVKELAQLLHLPDSIFDVFKKSPYRNPFIAAMEEREALAQAVRSIVVSVKERESQIAQNADLPADIPGRNALLRAGHTSAKTVKPLSMEELIAIDGIGSATAKRLHAALHPVKVAPPTRKASLAPTKPVETPKLAKTTMPYRMPEEALEHAQTTAWQDLVDPESTLPGAEKEAV